MADDKQKYLTNLVRLPVLLPVRLSLFRLILYFQLSPALYLPSSYFFSFPSWTGAIFLKYSSDFVDSFELSL